MSAKKVGKKKDKITVTKLTPEQSKQLDNAAKFVNDKWNSSCRSLIEIGEYLMNNFYDGDPEKAKAKGPKKGISLRMLAIRPDLHVSPATLSRARQLAVQEKMYFQQSTFTYLTDSHKLELLRIEDKKEKLKYAKSIEDKKLSCRAFRKVLEKDGHLLPRGPVPGSKRVSASSAIPFDLFFEPLGKITDLSIDDFIDSIPDDKSDEFIDSVKKAKEKLEKLYAKLTKSTP